MNKTLLLVICDFLLLNLLALTRWEKAEPLRPSHAPIPQQVSKGATNAENDLVETMRQSLADEQSNRTRLASELAQRTQAIASLESEKSLLSSSLQASQSKASSLDQQLLITEKEAAARKARLDALERALALREAEAKRQSEQLAALQKAQADATNKIQDLSVAVKVADEEKRLLRDTADSLKQQVAAERLERQKVQETTVQLAQGVGKLAANSGELTKEIRDNRPINANVLFNEFLANRVSVGIQAVRDNSFLGSLHRASETQCVIVSDGKQAYAVFHVNETPFSYLDPFIDWKTISVSIAHGTQHVSPTSLDFLSADPRIVAVPVDSAEIAALGAKVYRLAADPFKFPKAMLVNRGGKGYGEVPFQLDASNPGFVRMDNRLIKMLAGDFTPSRGDLVFSLNGDFLGIMVNSDYCAVLSSLIPAHSLTLPNTANEDTGRIFAEFGARIQSLPFRMQ